jgi:hypothetical protein
LAYPSKPTSYCFFLKPSDRIPHGDFERVHDAFWPVDTGHL